MALDRMGYLFDFLARRTPPGFALMSGKGAKARDFGLVGFAMMSMETLRAAFDHWNQYGLVAGHPLVTSITETGEEWSMHFEPRCHMTQDALRFCVEASISATVAIIEELTGAPAHGLRVDLPGEPPEDGVVHAYFGTGNIRYNQPHGVYCGRRADLDRAIPGRDDEIREMLHGQCAHLLVELTNARPLAERLEDLMHVSVGRIPSLNEMAARLNTSRRSLQRELNGQGLNYQELVRRFRQKHAFVLLQEGRANIKTIAYVLGFADVGSFRRAFHDWTGMPIGEWQKRQTRKAGGAQAGGRIIPAYTPQILHPPD